MLRSETAAKPERMKRALEGLRAYQEAPRAPPPPERPAIAARDGVQLRDYGGAGRPLLVVPSLINPPNVLDLTEEKSFLRWLAQQGHHVLLLDWGTDAARRRTMSVAAHVEQILCPLVQDIGEPPVLAGYCLGGTMATAAAARLPAAGLVTIAAPWHFSGFGEEARATLDAIWKQARPTVDLLGVLPMEVLQLAFWKLDPARTIGKFENFATLTPDGPAARAFVTLEDWANDGPPLPGAAAAEMMEAFFGDDRPGNDKWAVGGSWVDPNAIACPQLHIASTTDRIVPHATAIRTGERIDLDQGHVGMIVGSRGLSGLWEPLDAWLKREVG